MAGKLWSLPKLQVSYIVDVYTKTPIDSVDRTVLEAEVNMGGGKAVVSSEVTGQLDRRRVHENAHRFC